MENIYQKIFLFQFEVDVHVENEGAKQMKMAAESMRNLPIFKNDEEKIQFEACVDVDLSQVYETKTVAFTLVKRLMIKTN